MADVMESRVSLSVVKPPLVIHEFDITGHLANDLGREQELDIDC